jgi:hypothetical protein
MSSRSLAAARARRAGENVPPVSGNRPITSIGSQAAFAQMPPNARYNTNVRTARGMQPPQPPHPPQKPGLQQNIYYEQEQQASSNGLPFSKLSISDAIGLITLRLGRVEQWIIDTDHEESANGKSSTPAIPDNHKIIDSSVLTTMINRLDSLEKGLMNIDTQNNNQNNSQYTEEIAKLSEEVKQLSDKLNWVENEIVKHTLELSKSNEQLFRFNRDLTETKDILKTFMMKYDMFAQDITKNFADYETALSDIEKFLEGEKQLLESERQAHAQMQLQNQTVEQVSVADQSEISQEANVPEEVQESDVHADS